MKKYSLLLLSLLPAMAFADKEELRTPNNSFVVELNKGAEPSKILRRPTMPTGVVPTSILPMEPHIPRMRFA